MADDLGNNESRADPFRRGLLTHCYRLLGSLHEAQNLVEQTSATTQYYGTDLGVDDQTRSGLYGAATQRFLASADAEPRGGLAGAGASTSAGSGRLLPTGLGGPSDNPEGALAARPEVLWLEPIPDELVDGGPIGLDLIAALQYLPPRERAAVILSDIEGWPAQELCEVLTASTARVDRLLMEARSHLNPGPAHTGADQPDLLDRYSRAFELYDVPAIVELFTPDAVWEMPPFTSWFRGAKNIGRLISAHCPAEGPGDQLLVPLWANGQPGFAVYMRDPVEGAHRAFQIQVLTLTAAGIIHAVAFFDVSLFDAFNLPDLFTNLPENAFEHRPRIHVERFRKNHDNGG
jgi:RNA polymerase sigma-70 factor (ECF subfamily)